MGLPTGGTYTGDEVLKKHRLSKWQMHDMSGTLLVASGYFCAACEEFFKTKDKVKEECTKSPYGLRSFHLGA